MMCEADCRCPGCGTCSAHNKESKYIQQIQDLKYIEKCRDKEIASLREQYSSNLKALDELKELNGQLQQRNVYLENAINHYKNVQYTSLKEKEILEQKIKTLEDIIVNISISSLHRINLSGEEAEELFKRGE